MNFNKEELIKSPLNYTGGKFKLLPQILPLLPDNIDTFVDLFCGGCNVGINVKANNIICNDIESYVIDLMNYFKENNFDDVNNTIKNSIFKMGLSKNNKESYIELRNRFNKEKTIIDFYLLICHSFSNQIRFNKKGEFNLPFGGRSFNENMEVNLKNMMSKLHQDNSIFTFTNKKYDELISSILNSDKKNIFIYCDPPYSLNYKEYNGVHYWRENDDIALFEKLDLCDNKNIKFALSNTIESKEKLHNSLIEWSEKYNIHYLKHDYKNCNYNRKINKDIEVLITNY